jgi:hypothetical protein
MPQQNPQGDWIAAKDRLLNKGWQASAIKPVPPKSIPDHILQFLTGIANPATETADDPELGTSDLAMAAMPFIGGIGKVGAKAAMGLGKLPFKGPEGFYSRVNRIAEGLPDAIHPNKFAALLKSGAAQEEVAYRQIPEFLQSANNRNISKEDIFKWLTEHPAPEINVGRRVESLTVDQRRKMNELQDYGRPRTPEQIAEYQRLQVLDHQRSNYSQYKVPGGSNYQETLMQYKPQVNSGKSGWSVLDKDGGVVERFVNEAEANHLASILGSNEFKVKPTQVGEIDNYFGPHWPDDPNVLVHGRSQTMRSGSPGHLIENVQSDLHQLGRKTGYYDPQKPYNVFDPKDGVSIANFKTEDEALEFINRHDNAQYLDYSTPDMQEGAPSFPLKADWPDLQFKQEILDAARKPDAEWTGVTGSEHLRKRGETISPQFQDQRLPDTLKKLLKPFGGGPIEQVSLQDAAKAWIARLTPEMKAQIISKGFPLMTVALMAVGGSTNRSNPPQLLPK